MQVGCKKCSAKLTHATIYTCCLNFAIVVTDLLFTFWQGKYCYGFWTIVKTRHVHIINFVKRKFFFSQVSLSKSKYFFICSLLNVWALTVEADFDLRRETFLFCWQNPFNQSNPASFFYCFFFKLFGIPANSNSRFRIFLKLIQNV